MSEATCLVTPAKKAKSVSGASICTCTIRLCVWCNTFKNRLNLSTCVAGGGVSICT